MIRRQMTDGARALGATPEDIAAVERAFAKGNHGTPTVITYADANHLFMPAQTGQPTEYASLPKTFVPALLDDLTRWISALP